MADFLAIAAAIATKAGGISGIRESTHLVPDEIAAAPSFVVFPPNGALTEPPSQEIVATTFPSTLYLDRPASAGRALIAVYPYLGAFLQAWRTGRTLGLPGYVQESWIASWALDDFPDYEAPYIGIHFLIGVRTRENVSRSS